MSEVCALEIMQNQGLITVIDKEYKFYFIDNVLKDKCNIVGKLKLPIKEVTIKQKGDFFASRFRELMKENGYFFLGKRRPEIFIKEEDIKNFVKEIPRVEILYTNDMNSFLRDLIECFGEIEASSIYTYPDYYFRSGRCTKIIRNDVKKEREKEEKRKELEAIGFMEKLF